MASSDVARRIDPSPQYIQYLPSIFAAMRRPSALKLRDDACRFVLEAGVFSAGGGEECGAVFCPVLQVARGGDADRVGLAVPLRVGEHIGAVFELDDARIFNAAGPLARFLVVFSGIKDGSARAREMDAIDALRHAEARGVHADLHGAGVVFRAIEHVDLAVADNGCGIEGMERLPLRGSLQMGS